MGDFNSASANKFADHSVPGDNVVVRDLVPFEPLDRFQLPFHSLIADSGIEKTRVGIESFWLGK